MIPAHGYAAHDPSSPLAPWRFDRRETGPSDVRIQIQFCGVCHSDLHFVRGEWGTGLIRGWTDDGPSGPWMEWPERVGDRIAAAALGAAPGQTVLADSTTVLLYKLARAAVDDGLAAGRDEIVASTDDFPTDRYVLEGIAAERGDVESELAGQPQARTRRHHDMRQDQPFQRPGSARALLLVDHGQLHAGKLDRGVTRKSDKRFGRHRVLLVRHGR